MQVKVSFFVGGSIKEIVNVDKFEDADKVAKLRNSFCKVVNRKVWMKWLNDEYVFLVCFVYDRSLVDVSILLFI